MSTDELREILPKTQFAVANGSTHKLPLVTCNTLSKADQPVS